MSYSVYIGGNTNESTLVYLIPLIKELLKDYDISYIIYEKKITNKIIINCIKKSLDNSVLIQEEKLSFFLTLIYTIKFIFDKGIKTFINIITQSDRKLILKSSHNYSLRHAILDTSNQFLVEEKLRCSKLNYFKSCIHVFTSYQRGVYLTKMNLLLVYTAHTVYSHRALICGISENSNVKYFMSNYGPSVYLFDPHNETNQYLLRKKQWMTFIRNCKDKDILEFWKNRVSIGSTYDDSNRALKGKQSVPSDYPKNIIFLHVFKDSPFNYLDKNRIFSDYIDWIECTLNILKYSNERWAIRIHPSSYAWGECSLTILNTLLRKSFGKSLPKKIVIDNSSFSNISVLKHASRIITYSGTVHLEAACLGLRPIVISKCPLGTFSDKLIHYPQSLETYKMMLLLESNNDYFKLGRSGQQVGKSILYLIEEKLNFKKELFGKYLYRNSTSDDVVENLNIILRKIKDSKLYLQNLSLSLQLVGITMNDEFCEILKKKYVKS